MEFILVLLRIIHIFAGVFWTGAAWMMVLFIEPTIGALGPDGRKFMNHLSSVRRYPLYLSLAAVLTLLAGWILFFWRYGLVGLSTPTGLSFAIGGVLGLAAGVIGGLASPTAAKMTKLGTEIARQGKPPTPEQTAEMSALQTRLRRANLWMAILATFALLTMATARYA